MYMYTFELTAHGFSSNPSILPLKPRGDQSKNSVISFNNNCCNKVSKPFWTNLLLLFMSWVLIYQLYLPDLLYHTINVIVCIYISYQREGCPKPKKINPNWKIWGTPYLKHAHMYTYIYIYIFTYTNISVYFIPIETR